MELKLLKVTEPSFCSKIDGPSSVMQMMKEEAKADRECFWVLHLNIAHKVIEKELVSMGIIDQSLIHPREVFRKAVMLGTSAIITVHNHPSGALEPSKEDWKTWARLREAGSILGINVIDNIIITPEGHYWSEKYLIL